MVVAYGRWSHIEVRVYEYKSDVYRLLLKMGTWLTGE